MYKTNKKYNNNKTRNNVVMRLENMSGEVPEVHRLSGNNPYYCVVRGVELRNATYIQHCVIYNK